MKEGGRDGGVGNVPSGCVMQITAHASRLQGENRSVCSEQSQPVRLKHGEQQLSQSDTVGVCECVCVDVGSLTTETHPDHFL